MMIVLTIFYTFLFGSSIPNYPLFVLPALLAWRFFAVGTQTSLESIAGNSSLVTKVFFPRWLLVLSSNLANLIGSSLEFIALSPLMIALGAKLSVVLVLLPVILLLELLLISGISLILSSVNVYYRDFGQIWEIFLQAAFFLTPIFYSQSAIPQKYNIVYSLNPAARIIESVRGIIYYGSAPTAFDFFIVLVAALLSLLIGSIVFRRLEGSFAEKV